MKDGKRFTMEDGNNYIQIAWPEALLENEYGFCVGYLMPLIDLSQAASLDHFMQKAIRQKLKLTEKYEHRLQAAYNLCTMVAALHEKGHYIVDLKPSNVYVYKQSMLIAILDCDGFSIRGENGRYPAEFVSEEYIYPEGMKQNCDQMGEEQDKFALAVILFKLLNNGIHPFPACRANRAFPTSPFRNGSPPIIMPTVPGRTCIRRRTLTAFTTTLPKTRWNFSTAPSSKE